MRACAIAGLSVAVFGTMLAMPGPAVAAKASAGVRFDCVVRTVSDDYGITEYMGCIQNGKYRVSLRTKDTKLDGWPSIATIRRGGINIVTARADGKGKWSPWMTTGWTTSKGPYTVNA
ncbi:MULTISPECIES: hypothetical protein [unclassified Streptomyces]|uniref:hypothetical protein n=1 Tax=unclassified Streptomyces TaxID=2593676 RepID=UPI0004C41033